MPFRRFPPPWSVEEQPACFVVRDHNGQQLAYVYFEDEPRRRSAAKLLSKDEARRIGGQYRQAAGATAEADNASIRIAASIWLVVWLVVWPLVVRARSAAAANATHIPDALF
jgi:hypothetical protein